MPSSTADEKPAQTVTLREVLSVLRRRLVTVVIVALAGGLLAGAAALAAPAVYSATAVVTLVSISDNPLAAGTPRAPNTATEAQVARSTAVIERAAGTLDDSIDAAALAESVSVSSPQDSQALAITVAMPDGAQAAAAANAVAQQYLDYRSELVRTQLEETATTLDAQIADFARRQARALDAARTGPEPERAAASAEADGLTSALESRRAVRAQIDTAPNTAGYLVGQAVEPTSPSGPGALLLIAAGLAVGLVTGTVTALLRDRLDQRLADAGQVRSRAGAEVVAELPIDDEGPDGERRAQEGYRRLAALLAADLRRRPPGPLLITGSGGLTDTECAVRVACAMARHLPGLTLLCSEETRPTATAAVDRFTVGGPRPRVGGFGTEERLSVSTPLGVGGAPVVVDGVTVRHRSTSLALAASSRAVLVVAQSSVTGADELRTDLRDLQIAGATLVGVALLIPPAGRRRSRRGQAGGESLPDPVEPPAASPTEVHPSGSDAPVGLVPAVRPVDIPASGAGGKDGSTDPRRSALPSPGDGAAVLPAPAGPPATAPTRGAVSREPAEGTGSRPERHPDRRNGTVVKED